MTNTTQVCEDICRTLGSRKKLMEIIIRSCVRTIYREYRKRYRKNGKASSNLRRWLREAQQNPKPHENDDKFYINTEIYIPDPSEILFYDFLARWSGEKIALVLKHFDLLN
ncbi:unnamed protein product [Rhizophagus irregularis]|nr:unnamed protein product [Rhizophagus irregularis]CAB5372560.1 unnamed protein product [Rhizophagus irregularis]